MSDQTDNIKTILEKFGLNQEEIELYLELLQNTSLSALELSRKLNIGRTKVYRLTDLLHEKGLVNIIVDDYGNKFEANSPKNLERVLTEREAELEELKQESSNLMDELERLKPATLGETKILYYKGAEGLKQVTWNTLRAKSPFRIYEVNLMHAFLDKEFSEKVRNEFALRDIKVHQLTNHDYFEPFTNITKHVHDWTLKYIPKDRLDIKIEACVYNDVYAMYSFEKDNVFCVEIYNQRLADMQKQIFDLVFSVARPMKIVNDKGEATLE